MVSFYVFHLQYFYTFCRLKQNYIVQLFDKEVYDYKEWRSIKAIISKVYFISKLIRSVFWFVLFLFKPFKTFVWTYLKALSYYAILSVLLISDIGILNIIYSNYVLFMQDIHCLMSIVILDHLFWG